jgi:cytochrome c oxidase subunit 2
MNFNKNKFNYFIIAFIVVAFMIYRAPTVYSDIPRDNQVLFQDPATWAMSGIIDLHHEIMFWVTFIVFFVFQFLIIEIYFFSISVEKTKSIRFMFERFEFKACPILESVWTIIPICILWAIASPSIALLYTIEEEIQPQFTAKIIGHQWYWSYELSDFINYNKNSYTKSISFDSYILPKNEVFYGKIRLLDVDYSLYLPIHMDIRLLITSEDVIHSWTIPSFGIKLDAIPGRLNTSTIYINRPGVFYGQCSELCGVGHGFMPICVHAVSKITFVEWVISMLNLSKYSYYSYYILNSFQGIKRYES